MKNPGFARRRSLLTVVCLLGIPTPGWADGEYRTIAYTGQIAPGTPAAMFDDIGPVVIDALGRVALWSSVDPVGINGESRRGIWSEGGGNGLGLVALRGEPAVGGSVVYQHLDAPVMNSVGQVAFRSSLSGPGIVGSDYSGLWAGDEVNGLRRIVKTGDIAPGLPAGTAFKGFVESPSMNSTGQVAFTSNLVGPGLDFSNSRSLWRESAGGNLQLLAREGTQAPGLPAGVIFSELGRPDFSDSGRGVFSGLLSGPGITSENAKGIWGEAAGSGLRMIARVGDQVPGLPAGVNFLNFSPPMTTPAGQILLHASLVGPGIDLTNNTGVWRVTPLEAGGTEFDLVVRDGDPAPGLPAGSTFTGFGHGFPDTSPVANVRGEIALLGKFKRPDERFGDSGIWSEGGGDGLQLVAKEGDPAPGTSDGVYFDAFGFTQTSFPLLNAAGQTAFVSELGGPGTNNAKRALFVHTPGEETQLIVREGNFIDVNDDPQVEELRQVQFFDFADSTDWDVGALSGRRSGFNDRGEVAFYATFTDGSSGAFVSRLALFEIPGDFNDDGIVNTADYTVWRDGFGTTYAQADYDIWHENFGATTATWRRNQGTAVPEPTAACLVVISLLAAFRRARE